VALRNRVAVDRIRTAVSETFTTGAPRPAHDAVMIEDTLRSFRRGEPGYDAHRAGFNTVIEHHPEHVVVATDPATVVAAVEHACRTGRPVAVLNTGHGPSVPADGAVLIRTGGMNRVVVDPVQRTARVEAGAAWRDVIDAAAEHGLAPLNGSSPHVGAVGYTLGGGVGLLGRRFGFAADHVRELDVVTADGRLRQVDAGSDPDLFWALRGAGANFGVVTAMEIELFPVATLLGGELVFGPELVTDVLHTYAGWAREVPETTASSVLLLEYPDDPAVPDPMRGRFCAHVRVADSGPDRDAAARSIDRLRRIGPTLLDTVRPMPYAEVGSIHHEPTDVPVPAFDRNILLRDFDPGAAATLGQHSGPFLVELRAWGGALARPPAVPNAVAGRDAAFSLTAISDPDPDHRAARDALLTAMRPWSTGGSFVNFAGVEDACGEAVARFHRADDLARLRELKAEYDPDATFRINFTIPPAAPKR
jgi:FAD/FMN-containing dehydrogenase